MRQCGKHTKYTVALLLQPWLCESATMWAFSIMLNSTLSKRQTRPYALKCGEP
jgi:hypothetical protein